MDKSFLGLFLRRKPTVPTNVEVTAGEAATRAIEPIGGQEAPDPVRQSKVLARAARMPKTVFTNIPGILSVMQDEFGYPTFAPSPHAWYLLGPGAQLPWDDRENIQTPQSEAYGSTFILSSRPMPLDGVYAKLT